MELQKNLSCQKMLFTILDLLKVNPLWFTGPRIEQRQYSTSKEIFTLYFSYMHFLRCLLWAGFQRPKSMGIQLF